MMKLHLVVDQVAERFLAIGGQPVATMKKYLESATLELKQLMKLKLPKW